MKINEAPNVRAALWLVLGAAVILISRSLIGPSASLYRDIVPHTAGVSGVAWVAKIGVIAVAILHLALLWNARGRQAESIAGGIAAGVGVLIAFGFDTVLKSLVAEPRPCGVVLHLANCPTAGDWSFPSNHSVIAFSLAAAVLTLSARWAWTAVLLSVVVACGRVAEGVHYPHDVVAGAALGFAIVMATVIWAERPVAVLLGRLCQIDLFARLATTRPTVQSDR